MRIAIDSGPLSGGHSVRGVGLSIKSLIESLKKYNNEKEININPVDFSTTDLTGYDVLHYTAFNPFFLNNPRIGSNKSKIVITIHDLIPLIYKEQYPSGVRGFLNCQINKILLKKADSIITVSETSKKDIVSYFDLIPKKINVIYWAADDIFREGANSKDLSEVKRLYKLPDRFILYVGDVNYNKNLSTLIKACAMRNIPLVIVGKQASNINELILGSKGANGPRDIFRNISKKPHPELAHLNILSQLLKRNKVITTGFVPKEDLIAIYKLATVYCQPSYYEGFGMPVIEAFSCEVPVIISRTQALVEVAGGGALVADPYSAKDFSEKIALLLNDSTFRLHLVRAGKTRSKQFSWEKTAKRTIEIYKKILEE